MRVRCTTYVPLTKWPNLDRRGFKIGCFRRAAAPSVEIYVQFPRQLLAACHRDQSLAKSVFLAVAAWLPRVTKDGWCGGVARPILLRQCRGKRAKRCCISVANPELPPPSKPTPPLVGAYRGKQVLRLVHDDCARGRSGNVRVVIVRLLQDNAAGLTPRPSSLGDLPNDFKDNEPPLRAALHVLRVRSTASPLPCGRVRHSLAWVRCADGGASCGYSWGSKLGRRRDES
jgi:hypothetical protein